VGYKSVSIGKKNLAMIRERLSGLPLNTAPTYSRGLTVTMDKFVLRDVTDDDEDMGFGYKVEFLNRNREPVGGPLEGAVKKKYVEQPSKIGTTANKNLFFAGRKKNVRDDIHSVRLTVWAKTFDNDCSKPWRHGKTSQSIEYKFSEFSTEPEKTFSAWKCIDVTLRFTDIIAGGTRQLTER
jgi:hypothetical protein